MTNRGQRHHVAATSAALAALLLVACAASVVPPAPPTALLAPSPTTVPTVFAPASATAAATAPATPIPRPVLPTATATAAPTVTVDEFLQRMRVYWSGPVFNQLTVLPAIERDDPLFGIDDALVEENWTAPLMQASGATLDRVEVRWDVIEPAPGTFQFDELDRVLRDAPRWHLSVLAVVDGVPRWAVDRPEHVGSGPPVGLDTPALLPDGEPDPRNPWAVFLATVARHYGGQIGAWEIWNEPNLPEFWGGTPADYALLLRAARTTLDVAAPGAPVLVAGMVEDDGKFLGQVMPDLCPKNTCASSPFDGVAWHIYNDPIGLPRVAGQTRALLAPYHLDPAIWITEANVPIDDPTAPVTIFVGPDSATLEQQAAFVLQIYALARAEGVHTVAIYRASDIDADRHYWGLIRNDISGRPALFAYRAAAAWLSHTRFVRLTHPTPATTWIELRRADQEIHVLWTTTTQPATVRVPSTAATGQLVDVTGAAKPIRATGGAFSLTLPGAPADRRPKTAPLADPVILVVPASANP